MCIIQTKIGTTFTSACTVQQLTFSSRGTPNNLAMHRKLEGPQ